MHSHRGTKGALRLLGVVCVVAGCAQDDGSAAQARGQAGSSPFDSAGVGIDSAGSPPSDSLAVRTARADLEPTQTNEVRGTVTFRQEDAGVRVTAHILGLDPGEHGFHVHENGDCSASDASSAGDHFNPQAMPHAGPDAPRRHAGDLGNITAGQDGVAHYDRVDNRITLEGPNSIVGRAVIVHSRPDDMTSQPSGNAGGRLACGVIREPLGGASRGDGMGAMPGDSLPRGRAPMPGDSIPAPGQLPPDSVQEGR